MATRRTYTRVTLSDERGVFMISVAAELAEMHPQTLRMYESRGLIAPQRSPKGTRLYSQSDVERLRRIQQLTAELGLNLAGVERVFALEAELDRMTARVEALERRAARAQAELERARAASRTEIVPYRSSGRALVPADGSNQDFQALLVQQTEQLQGRPARVFVANFPLTNSRQAGVEYGREDCLAEFVPGAQRTDLRA